MSFAPAGLSAERRIKTMLDLRKFSNQAARTGSNVVEKIGEGLNYAGRNASEGARCTYNYAMNHPKASAAVLLGAGVAAGLLWLVQRNGGFRSIYRQTVSRVRAAPKPRTRARAHRAAAR
jgi:hypothetical protein